MNELYYIINLGICFGILSHSRKLQAECRKLKIWERINLVAFSRNYSTEELQIPNCPYCYFKPLIGN